MWICLFTFFEVTGRGSGLTGGDKNSRNVNKRDVVQTTTIVMKTNLDSLVVNVCCVKTIEPL